MPHNRRFYFNALFDLELGGFPTGSVRRSAAEMTVLFIPLLRHGDRVVLDVAVPDDYREYLFKHGLVGDDFFDDASLREQYEEDVVWGWNRQAVSKLTPIDSAKIPDLECVKRVNARHFCWEKGRQRGFGVPRSFFCTTIEEAGHALDALRREYPVVVKPSFGGSGFGIKVLENKRQADREQKCVEGLLHYGGIIVEPWYMRVADLSSTTDIGSDGMIGPVDIHRQRVNSFGAFYGVFRSDDTTSFNRWEKRIRYMTQTLAGDVADMGYFGPVGFDSFVYLDRNGNEKLAAGIEINARCTAGRIAEAVRTKIAADRSVLLRFLSRKKCTLPSAYSQWNDCIKADAFDPATRCGIVVLTPLRAGYQGVWEQPRRNVFVIAGKSEKQILAYDDMLRKKTARRKAER